MKKIKKWFTILIGVLLILAILRSVLFSLYYIPSNGMANTLLEGDRVFVLKTSYGLKFPILKKKIFESGANKKDIVFFENPLSNSNKILQSETLVGQVAGLPGDSLQINKSFIIDNKTGIKPDAKSIYSIALKKSDVVDSISAVFNIHGTIIKTDSAFVYKTFNDYEAYILTDIDSDLITKINDQNDGVNLHHSIIVPTKDKSTVITPWNISLVYNAILLHETEASVTFENNSININNEPIKNYTFSQNYYWITVNDPLLMDDSSAYGFVPESKIIGKGIFICFAKDSSKNVFNGYNWDRVFQKIR